LAEIKLGLIPPLLRGKSTDPRWVSELLEAVEGAGVESIWGVEHVVVAEDYEPLYPYSADGRMPGGGGVNVMPDPLEWLSFAAAKTTRLRLGTAVIIASQHSAAILAKRAATLDSLSGGRLILGVGLGWQKEEYAAIGVPYSDRGRRLDECIEAMRALWTQHPATYEGKHVRFRRVHCNVDLATPGGPPIVIGGSTPFAARRAGRLGDGFFPFVISPEDFALRLGEIRAAAREAGRDASRIELTVWPGSWDFKRTFDLGLVRAFVQQGASRLVVSGLESGSADLPALRDFIRRYQDEVLGKL
jgi:probable F420-dependent oxidoreductase